MHIIIFAGELSTKLMECKDLRVKTMAEVLYGIRVLKLHVWEDHFIRKIGSKLRYKLIMTGKDTRR
jgi:ATP-binding cassette subfamily C (CFTR/MRP) protein 10